MSLWAAGVGVREAPLSSPSSVSSFPAPSRRSGIRCRNRRWPGAAARAPSKHNKSLDHQPHKSLLIKGFGGGCSKSRRDPVEAGQCKHLGKGLGFQTRSPQRGLTQRSTPAGKEGRALAPMLLRQQRNGKTPSLPTGPDQQRARNLAAGSFFPLSFCVCLLLLLIPLLGH